MIALQAPSRIMNYDEELIAFRKGPVIYVDGKPSNATYERIRLQCNVQPFGGRDLLLVPEHDRFKEQYWVYTQANAINDSDRIVRKSDVTGTVANFQVQSVEAWGSFQRARMVRIDVGPDQTP